jgi:hypothetical protein
MMQQHQFHQAIGDWSSPLPHPRMRVYRNNVAAALVSALQVRYPVTAQLVGEEFFFGMARLFAETTRPQSPVLIEYGRAFADFIRGFAPASGLAYLGDVADLESLWWQAYHAREAQPLAASALAGMAPESLGELRLDLHPSVGLFASGHAVASIWEAHHGGAAMGTFAPDQPQHVLVSRPTAEIGIRAISPETFAFLMALKQGETLADAVEAAAARNPDLDISAQIGGSFSLGLITGFSA